MDIRFDKSTRLSQLQNDFHKRFEFLKIEFFKDKKEVNPKYMAKDMLETSLRIQDVTDGMEHEPVHITGLMKVRDVEQSFSDKLGIHVQIFRKSGNVWLMTLSSDHLTLDELNKDGRDREIVPKNSKEENDYHEQE